MMTLDSDLPDVVALKKKFRKLAKKPLEVQLKTFCERFIFTIDEDGYEEAKDAAAEFEKYLKGNNKEMEIKDPKTSKFLEESGHEFVSQFEKNAIFAVLDIDNNKSICLTEYLLFCFKPQILTEYYMRTEQPHRIPEDPDVLFKCIDPDTGYALASELLEMPAYGRDKDLDKMTKSLADEKKATRLEIEKLQRDLKSEKMVVRKAAEQRLRILGEGNHEQLQSKKHLSIQRRGRLIQKEQRATIIKYDRKGQSEAERPQTVIGGAKKLPPGWKEYFDDASGLPYYYNESTGETQWETPM